ncbi:heavy metal sensor histidine kinase [Hydrogenophaga sp. PML113]|uniref:heavy metal sensor histidine kinase n=1 Tax=Hydrogenophaga sp. PML113 TaxID=1899350 RepID=UPI0008790258|nr:heavy metal sensor histidine kinase [Hydrogenophaga sp. PML113]
MAKLEASQLSLTVRLTALFALVVGAVFSGLGYLVHRETAAHFVELDQALLRDKLALIRGIVDRSTGLHDLSVQLRAALQGHEGLLLRIDMAGQELVHLGDFEVPAALRDTPAGHSWSEGDLSYYGKLTTLPLHWSPDTPLKVLTAVDTHHHRHFLVLLQRKLLVYIALAIAASTLLGAVAVRRGLRPLLAMKHRAERVNARDFTERMPVDSLPVEMRGLASSINDMLDRLQRDFDRLNAFSTDLAHELRTPLSNLLTNAQVTLAVPRGSDEYRASLEIISEELQRLGKTVSDMLYLAKTENVATLPSVEDVDLAAEARSLIDFYEAVAEEKGVRFGLSGEERVRGDRLMIRRAIGNLLSNAVRHAPVGDTVELRIDANEHWVWLQVSNAAEPLTVEQRQAMFDRFFRLSQGRHRLEGEGVGLGLPITRAIMSGHRGEVDVRCEGGRIHFTLGFPREA